MVHKSTGRGSVYHTGSDSMSRTGSSASAQQDRISSTKPHKKRFSMFSKSRITGLMNRKTSSQSEKSSFRSGKGELSQSSKPDARSGAERDARSLANLPDTKEAASQVASRFSQGRQPGIKRPLPDTPPATPEAYPEAYKRPRSYGRVHNLPENIYSNRRNSSEKTHGRLDSNYDSLSEPLYDRPQKSKSINSIIQSLPKPLKRCLSGSSHSSRDSGEYSSPSIATKTNKAGSPPAPRPKSYRRRVDAVENIEGRIVAVENSGYQREGLANVSNERHYDIPNSVRPNTAKTVSHMTGQRDHGDSHYQVPRSSNYRNRPLPPLPRSGEPIYDEARVAKTLLDGGYLHGSHAPAQPGEPVYLTPNVENSEQYSDAIPAMGRSPVGLSDQKPVTPRAEASIVSDNTIAESPEPLIDARKLMYDKYDYSIEVFGEQVVQLLFQAGNQQAMLGRLEAHAKQFRETAETHLTVIKDHQENLMPDVKTVGTTYQDVGTRPQVEVGITKRQSEDRIDENYKTLAALKSTVSDSLLELGISNEDDIANDDLGAKGLFLLYTKLDEILSDPDHHFDIFSDNILSQHKIVETRSRVRREALEEANSHLRREKQGIIDRLRGARNRFLRRRRRRDEVGPEKT